MDVNYKIIAVVYCVVIILVTSDFIMNLILGVFCEVFKEERLASEKQKEKELEEELKKYNEDSDASALS